MSKNIESSRYANRVAWFHGDESGGDYYDQTTGTYLGSWSRTAGQFSNPDKSVANLFVIDDWKNRGLVQKFLQSARLAPVVEQIKQLAAPAPDPLRLPGQYIAFIGDSFCAHISREDHERFQLAGHDMAYRRTSDEMAYTSMVAQELKLNIAPYGYAGRSWWWSWQKFWQDWYQDLRRLDVIVFLHSGYDRINNGIDPELPHIFNMPASFSQSHAADKVQAMESYFLHVHDPDFQRWAQQQFFRYIRDILPPMKILHFFCMAGPTPATCDLLTGMVFRTPLLLLSAAEIKGEHPRFMPIPDLRANHFNEHNNRTMASLICQHLTDYRAGHYDIPWQTFHQRRPKKFADMLANWPKWT